MLNMRQIVAAVVVGGSAAAEHRRPVAGADSTFGSGGGRLRDRSRYEHLAVEGQVLHDQAEVVRVRQACHVLLRITFAGQVGQHEAVIAAS